MNKLQKIVCCVILFILALLFIAFISSAKIIEGHGGRGRGRGLGYYGRGLGTGLGTGYYGGSALDVNPLYMYDDDDYYPHYPYWYRYIFHL